MANFMAKYGTKIFIAAGSLLGVGATVSAVTATPRAMQLIKNAEDEKGEKLTVKETIKVAWKPYIPALGLTLASTTCLIAADRVSVRTIAAVTAECAIKKADLDTYKKAVAKIIPPEKKEELNKQVIKEKMDKVPVPEKKEVPETVNPTVNTFFDPYGGRYFESNIETLRRKALELAEWIKREDYATVDTFFQDLMGLPVSAAETNIGWNINRIDIRDFNIKTYPFELPDGRYITAVDFSQEPKEDYYRG